MAFALTRNYDGYGSGFLNPDRTVFHVNISKNASSYMADILPRQGWTAARYGHDNCDYSSVTQVMVIMRDPVDRWCSGVGQYLSTRILNYVGIQTAIDTDAVYDIQDRPMSASAFLIAYSSLIERFIFDNLDLLDDHVWAQHEFFQDILPHVPRKFLLMNANGMTLDQQLLAMDIKTYADADQNSSDNDPEKSSLKYFFRQRLLDKPNLMNLVRRTYARDYEIINQVTMTCPNSTT